jgi:hypothetical protein
MIDPKEWMKPGGYISVPEGFLMKPAQSIADLPPPLEACPICQRFPIIWEEGEGAETRLLYECACGERSRREYDVPLPMATGQWNTWAQSTARLLGIEERDPDEITMEEVKRRVQRLQDQHRRDQEELMRKMVGTTWPQLGAPLFPQLPPQQFPVDPISPLPKKKPSWWPF